MLTPFWHEVEIEIRIKDVGIGSRMCKQQKVADGNDVVNIRRISDKLLHYLRYCPTNRLWKWWAAFLNSLL